MDITTETLEMASMMYMPREGNLEQLFNMFVYLRIKHNSSMVFYPIEPDIEDSQLVSKDCSASAYGEQK